MSPRFEPGREQLDRRSPIGRWQVITKTFTAANTDTVVVHQLPTPKAEMVDYEVLRSNAPCTISHDGNADRKPWGDGYIVLRSDVAPVEVDLRLTVSAERRLNRRPPSGVAGTGSGNADTLDGLDSTAFALAGHTHDLGDLGDVSTAGASSGDVLTFNGSTWDPAAPGAGSVTVVQHVHTQTGAVATGSTALPFDDTMPQNTEGDEYLTLAITPTDAANTLQLEIVLWGTADVGTPWISTALFQDTTADALAATALLPAVATGGGPIHFRHELTAGTTSATTFKVRAGTSDGTQMTVNGQSAGRIFGGVMASSLTITEIVP